MKIAIVVQGRFHAFDLARALLKRGNDVTVFTNYPAWAVKPFGIPAARVRSFTLHGVLVRVADRVRALTGWSWDPWLHPMFSRWARRQLASASWDVIYAWSGVAEDIYKEATFPDSLKLIMRGSAHIRQQARLLAAEELRVGCVVHQPSRWMIDREEREYALADKIVVLSGFAYGTFRAEGTAESRLRLLPLGTETTAFRPSPEVVEARCHRILSGTSLRVLYVGGISWQKGLAEIRAIVERTSGRFQLRFVGAVPKEARTAVSTIGSQATFAGKKRHYELPSEYAWGDLFIFPTIQDGFAVVLAQASAAALPILTTTNCSGPDLIREGRTGWILPIRDSSAFIDRLQWCDSHRTELAEMVRTSFVEFRTRDWSDVAADFESMCRAELNSRAMAATNV